MPLEAPDRTSRSALQGRLRRARNALTAALEVILALNVQTRRLSRSLASANATILRLNTLIAALKRRQLQ